MLIAAAPSVASVASPLLFLCRGGSTAATTATLAWPQPRRHQSIASTSASPIAYPHRPRRTFHSSSRVAYAQQSADHYQVLQVPRSANKQQIKAQFYRLSKEYHPDVKPGNEKRFQAISEAYATLGNVDARRAYDSSLTSSSSSAYAGPSSSATGSSSYWYPQQEMETSSTRRARANYAWEYTRRTSPRSYQRNNPFAQQQQQGSQYDGPGQSHFDRMQARQAWRASNMSAGARKRWEMEAERIQQEENLRNTSSLGRAVQMVAIFMAVVWVAGGLKAAAWEKEGAERELEGESCQSCTDEP